MAFDSSTLSIPLLAIRVIILPVNRNQMAPPAGLYFLPHQATSSWDEDGEASSISQSHCDGGQCIDCHKKSGGEAPDEMSAVSQEGERMN